MLRSFLSWFLDSALGALQTIKEKREAAFKAESERIHADVQAANDQARKAAAGGGS